MASLVTRTLLGALALATVFALVEPVATILDPPSRNYNEGWNALHTQRLLDGAPLYPPDDALFFNNYPPLSFHVVGAVARATGDPLTAGRIVSLVSMLVTVVCVGLVTGTIARCRGAGVFAAVLAAGVFAAHFRQYVAMNDPQMLGHALQWAALAIFLRTPARARTEWIVVALLVVGGLVKHNLVVVPLAVVLAAAWRERAVPTGLLVRAAVAVGAGVAWIVAAHGLEVFDHVLGHARTFDPRHAWWRLQDWVVPLAAILPAAAAGLARRPQEAVAPALVAAIGFAVGAVFAAGGGISYNVIFDPVLALCCLAAVLPFAFGGAVRPVLVVAVSSWTLVLLASAIPAGFEDLDRRDARNVAFAADLDFVAGHPGPVMAGTLVLAHAAGRDFAVDLFNVHEAMAAGAMAEERLLDRIRARRYAVIQLSAYDRTHRLGDRVMEVVERHYAPARTSDLHGRFYLPRPVPATARPQPER